MAQRVRIFVDYWNFSLAVGRWRNGFRLDWNSLGPWLTRKAQEKVGVPCSYEGMEVYMSYDPAKPDADGRLKKWAKSTLDRFSGVRVTLLERKAKRPPKCGHCKSEIPNCPACGADLRGTVEKGVDTALVTDMIRLAWANSFDIAVILSSDRDFIPAVEFLNQKGLRTINPYFPPKGFDLATRCWANVELPPVLSEIERK